MSLFRDLTTTTKRRRTTKTVDRENPKQMSILVGSESSMIFNWKRRVADVDTCAFSMWLPLSNDNPSYTSEKIRTRIGESSLSIRQCSERLRYAVGFSSSAMDANAQTCLTSPVKRREQTNTTFPRDDFDIHELLYFAGDMESTESELKTLSDVFGSSSSTGIYQSAEETHIRNITDFILISITPLRQKFALPQNSVNRVCILPTEYSAIRSCRHVRGL